MPQYKRVGHDFTMEMDNPSSEFWEPVAAEPVAGKTPTSTEAPEAEPEESDD